MAALDPARLVAANIRPDTLLATDYLNHFNEAAMLVEMLADAPDVAEDVLAWAPASYEAHFTASGFRDRELAVAAYQAARPDIRAALQAAAAQFDAVMVPFQAQVRVGDVTEAPAVADLLNAAIADMAAVIDGRALATAQDAIDALFD